MGAMKDNHVSTQPSSGKVYILPPWGTGDDPSVPTVDDGYNHSIADSAIGSVNAKSTTASLDSRIYDYVEENGRTYHRFKEGKYVLPNDQQEQERLDPQHALMAVRLRSLHLAPIGPNPQNALDVGTGTGLWAIEFAPLNCRFEIIDAEDEWVFSEPFDYIHGRMLLSCFKDPRSVFQQAFNPLTTGGYVELQDFAFPPQFLGEPLRESALYKWGQLMTEASVKLGRPWTNVPRYKEWLEEIGFEDVVEKKYYWPLNAWPKEDYYKLVSAYAKADLLNGLDGMSLNLLGFLGWSAEKVQEFLIEVKTDVENAALHSYGAMRVVYGRKPDVSL